MAKSGLKKDVLAKLENLRNKIDTFREVINTKKALFLTMITTFGIANNQYKGLVQNDLTMDILFE